MTRISASTTHSKFLKSPILLQVHKVPVPSNKGNKICALMDFCSMADYLTHSYAMKHKLQHDPVTIKISKINKKNKVVKTLEYKVPKILKGRKY